MSSRQHQAIILVGRHRAARESFGNAPPWCDWRPIECADADSALSFLDRETAAVVDAILIAEEDPCGRHEDAIGALKARRPDLPVILLASPDGPSPPVGALRSGACDYLKAPLTRERLRQVVHLARRRGPRWEHDLEPFSEKFGPVASFANMAGTEPAWRDALTQAALLAPGEEHLLIEGERGTGKTMLAGAIHTASLRARGPLHLCRSQALSEGALESLLFGHERGAFIGAFERRPGVLQSNNDATLVVQDVSSFPRRLQRRLAEALTRRRVRAIGADEDCALAARVIALSSRPLAELVADGAFDRQLYEVLEATRVRLPALRERPDDIARLSLSFLAWFHDHANLPALELSDDALAALRGYEWPGNARQLQSVLLRAALAAGSQPLTARHLPPLILRETLPARPPSGRSAVRTRHDPPGGPISLYTEDGHLRSLADIEADVIRLAIVHCRGRLGDAAQQLGMGRSTLYRKMRVLDDDSGTRQVGPCAPGGWGPPPCGPRAERQGKRGVRPAGEAPGRGAD